MVARRYEFYFRVAKQYFTNDIDKIIEGNDRNYVIDELTCEIGQFQKISIPNHGRLPCFNPPLPSEIPKCATPPCPQNSIVVTPPSPSEFPVFFGSTFST